MATRHYSKESVNSGNVNVVTGIDRNGQTAEQNAEKRRQEQELQVRRAQSVQPFEDVFGEVYRAVKSSGHLVEGWDDDNGVWEDSQANVGIDGVKGLRRIATRAYLEHGPAAREPKPYELDLIRHMRTVAHKHLGLANLDTVALGIASPGEKSSATEARVSDVLNRLFVEREEKVKSNDLLATRKIANQIAIVQKYAEMTKPDYPGVPNGGEARDFTVQSELADTDIEDASVDAEDRRSAYNPGEVEEGSSVQEKSLADTKAELDKVSLYNQIIGSGSDILASYYPSENLLQQYSVGSVHNVPSAPNTFVAWGVKERMPDNTFVISREDDDGNAVERRVSFHELRLMKEIYRESNVPQSPSETSSSSEPAPQDQASLEQIMTPEIKAASERLAGLRSELAETYGVLMTPEIEAASEHLAGLRSKLAEMYAIRQKSATGMDRMGSLNLNKQAVEFRRLKREYQAASQELLAAQIRGKLLEGKPFDIDLFIAEETLKIGHDLTDDIDENYASNSKILGKAINFLAGRTETGEKDTSKAKKYGRRSVKVLIGVTLAAGSVASGGALPVVAAAGAWAGTNLFANLNAKANEKRVKRGSRGLLSLEEIQAGMTDMLDERLDEKGELVRMPASAILDSRIKAASRVVERSLEDDTQQQQRRRLGRVGVSLAFGIAVGSIGHLAGNLLNGSESAQAAPSPDVSSVHTGAEAGADFGSAHSAVSEVATNTTNFGPSNIYINPGDGFNNLFQQMNIPQEQWSSLIDKVGPELVQHGDAYVMPDGSFGVSNVGQLSQQAFETILKSR